MASPQPCTNAEPPITISRSYGFRERRSSRPFVKPVWLFSRSLKSPYAGTYPVSHSSVDVVARGKKKGGEVGKTGPRMTEKWHLLVVFGQVQRRSNSLPLDDDGAGPLVPGPRLQGRLRANPDRTSERIPTSTCCVGVMDRGLVSSAPRTRGPLNGSWLLAQPRWLYPLGTSRPASAASTLLPRL